MRLVNNTCEQGQKLLSRANPEVRGQIEAEITAVKQIWTQLQRHINQACGNLEGQLAKWQAFTDCHMALQQWLGGVEDELKMGVEPKAELTEKRAQLEKFKVFVSALHVNSLHVSVLRQVWCYQ